MSQASCETLYNQKIKLDFHFNTLSKHVDFQKTVWFEGGRGVACAIFIVILLMTIKICYENYILWVRVLWSPFAEKIDTLQSSANSAEHRKHNASEMVWSEACSGTCGKDNSHRAHLPPRSDPIHLVVSPSSFGFSRTESFNPNDLIIKYTRFTPISLELEIEFWEHPSLLWYRFQNNSVMSICF